MRKLRPVTDLPDCSFSSQIAVRRWLFICALFVAMMLVIGGVTRLTGSGLSMVHWRPVTGILPPLNHTEWQAAFDAYQRSPEYQKVNMHMDLSGFQEIFWLEYIHRLIGRLTGLVFFIPFVYFMARRRLKSSQIWRYTGIFALGGMQGLMGWYMVKSGLIDDPDVSPYRLTAHLLLAFLIFALLWRSALMLGPAPPSYALASPWPRRLAALLLVLIPFQVALGGLVAGHDAGLIYNTFPDMNGQWVPDGLLADEPFWHNFIGNITMIQFQHRLGAYAVTLVGVFFWLACIRQGDSSTVRLGQLFLVTLAVQMTLGVLTLLHAVPVALGSLHQLGALALFTVVLTLQFRLGYRQPPITALTRK